jgi:hypothetical protein
VPNKTGSGRLDRDNSFFSSDKMLEAGHRHGGPALLLSWDVASGAISPQHGLDQPSTTINEVTDLMMSK